MRFGWNLPRNRVPEWAGFYLDYNRLRRLVREASETAQVGGKADLTTADLLVGLLAELDHNLSEVGNFFDKQVADAEQRLKLLKERYGGHVETVALLSDDDIEELKVTLLELRYRLRKLQWFGDINRRGFENISGKVERKLPRNSMSGHAGVMESSQRLTLPQRFGVEINKWHLTLREAQDLHKAESNSSTRFVRSLAAALATTGLTVPDATLEEVDQAIAEDDSEKLKAILDNGEMATFKPGVQIILLKLLQRAVSSASRACIRCLLERVTSLEDVDDMNGRNHIHRLVIGMGQVKSLKAGKPETILAYPKDSGSISCDLDPTWQQRDKSRSMLQGKDDSTVQILDYLLDSLTSEQRYALIARDQFGRFPLHYAAHYGMAGVCEIIAAKMTTWSEVQAGQGNFNLPTGPEWLDKDGNAPLNAAVVAGQLLAAKVLATAKASSSVSDSWRGAALMAATKANHHTVVDTLVQYGVDIDWQEATGETSLHMAARFGHVQCAKTLVKGSPEHRSNLEIQDKAFSRTPLHIAAIYGHLAVVLLLVEAAANVAAKDALGWTAQEHAAFRGHMKIANTLLQYTSTKTIPLKSPVPERHQSKDSRRATEYSSSASPRRLKDHNLILISLGSLDPRKSVRAVQLDPDTLAQALPGDSDAALKLVISADGAEGTCSIDLPIVSEDISTKPLRLLASDTSKVKVNFDIVSRNGDPKQRVGRGVALLDSVRTSIGEKRINLHGGVCVPILSGHLEIIGTVSFTFLAITAFTHPNMEANLQRTYWKKLESTMVVGHRGLGKNVVANKTMQIGENTVPSFMTAASLGANYVEFDVQLTKDHVPVIYHDFLVSETGIDVPVHTLTLEQFLHINSEKALGKTLDDADQVAMKTSGSEETDEHMRYTRDFKANGFKANTRGNFIQAPFATLEDLFRRLPEDIGFNIEMKYPTLEESLEQGMDTYAIDMNSFCDAVLEKVYGLAKDRNMVFSSFNPDLCVCLVEKQPCVPVLFLTDAGMSEMGDIRASSLQQAIRFAKDWDLLGIVSTSQPFVNSPQLVQVVKQNGLACLSYGTQNNDPALVQKQVEQGIDAVIVDNVLAIRKSLDLLEGKSEAK